MNSRLRASLAATLKLVLVGMLFYYIPLTAYVYGYLSQDRVRIGDKTYDLRCGWKVDYAVTTTNSTQFKLSRANLRNPWRSGNLIEIKSYHNDRFNEVTFSNGKTIVVPPIGLLKVGRDADLPREFRLNTGAEYLIGLKPSAAIVFQHEDDLASALAPTND